MRIHLIGPIRENLKIKDPPFKSLRIGRNRTIRQNSARNSQRGLQPLCSLLVRSSTCRFLLLWEHHFRLTCGLRPHVRLQVHRWTLYLPSHWRSEDEISDFIWAERDEAEERLWTSSELEDLWSSSELRPHGEETLWRAANTSTSGRGVRCDTHFKLRARSKRTWTNWAQRAQIVQCFCSDLGSNAENTAAETAQTTNSPFSRILSNLSDFHPNRNFSDFSIFREFTNRNQILES